MYLHNPSHAHHHHEILTHSRYQDDHSQMINVKEFVDAIVITLLVI